MEPGRSVSYRLTRPSRTARRGSRRRRDLGHRVLREQDRRGRSPRSTVPRPRARASASSCPAKSAAISSGVLKKNSLVSNRQCAGFFSVARLDAEERLVRVRVLGVEVVDVPSGDERKARLLGQSYQLGVDLLLPRAQRSVARRTSSRARRSARGDRGRNAVVQALLGERARNPP